MSLIDSNIKTGIISGGLGIIFQIPVRFLTFAELIIIRLINSSLYKRVIIAVRAAENPESIFKKRVPISVLSIFALTLILLIPTLSIAVPPGTIIDNMAEGTYSLGIISDIELQSNLVRVITVIHRTPSTINLLRFAPDNPDAEMVPVSTTYYSISGTPDGQFDPMSPPIAIGEVDPIDLNMPVPLIQSNRIAVGEPAFIRLRDQDQNIDTLLTETILVHLIINENNESELLRLTETSPNSGIFTGYIQTGDQYSPQANDGHLSADEGYELQADYVDLFDSEDVSSDSMSFILSDRSIYIVKSAGRNTVAPGDYLQYNLNVVNVTSVLFEDINIIDRLPYAARYKDGSATINGDHIQDPLISADGQVLTFDGGSMLPDQPIDLRYTVEIGTNARPGNLVNEAYAVDNFGTLSNIARVSVQVEEELFRNTCFIVGQVLSGDCDTVPEPDSVFGIEGARVFLEDGTYAVTDHNGRYHFEGAEPGVHVVQLDYQGLSDKYELLSCETNSGFAGNAYSMFVDLQGGSTWQADFMLKLKPPQSGNLTLRLESVLQDTLVSFELLLEVNTVPIRNPRIMIRLPDKLGYVAGSSRLAGTGYEEPQISGNILTYRIPNIPGDFTGILNFTTSLDKGDTPDSLNTLCKLIYDTPQGQNQETAKIENQIYLRPETKHIQLPQIILHPRFKSFSAELDAAEMKSLDRAVEVLKNANITEILVTGHSDNVPISPRSQFIYLDNYELSLARANSVANYLSISLGVDRSQFQVEGKGPDEPIADNSTSRGKALNRRVELTIFAEEILKNVIPEVAKKADTTAAKTIGLRPGELWEYPVTKNYEEISVNHYNQTWLNAAKPGFEWLWPPADFNPPIPSLKVAVKHHPDSALRLLLDGSEISPLNFSEKLVSNMKDKAVSLWSGIDIHQGFNNFAAVVFDEKGNEIERREIAIHYAGPPVYVEFIDSLSNLTADNSVQPTIAVRFTDKDGYPARPGVIGEWSVDPPYTAQQQIDRLQNDPLLRLQNEKCSYVIGKNGIAILKLQPSSRTGEAVLRFYFTDYEEEIRVWLKPKFRDWMVVGLAEGTVGYNRISGDEQSLDASGIDSKFHEDGRTAFFASGSVKKSWLLTVAGDTKKTGNASANDFMQTINPQAYYPLYGDAVQQGYASSSTQGVFIKVENNHYYALYGDYNTGLTHSELSRYDRTFTGLKSELKTRKHNFNIFLNQTNLAFVKDEIRGNGTSGLYYLSRNSIAVNSEKITIEVRDRFRNEEILSVQVMKRYLDYNIDYSEGSIYFTRPVASRDENLNPIFIVVDYESNDDSDKSYNYGGRGGVKALEGKLELGGTFIHEGRIGGYGNLGGIDAAYEIGRGTELKTEFAVSGMKMGAGNSIGYAYLTELIHNTGMFSGRVYARSLEPDFGLGQQNESQSGTRRIGADLVKRISERFQIGTELYRQYNLLSDSKRNFGEVRLNYNNKRFTARTGLRFAEDRLGNGVTNRSNQLSAGVGYRFLDGKLAVRLDREQSIGENENADFPTRTILGADYNLSRYITIYAEQEFARGKFEDAQDSRVGIRARPWAGAQLNSGIQRHYNENGERVFSNFGLIQSWKINEKLSVDFGIDHGKLVQDPGNYRFNPNEPPVSGSLDGFTALSLGGSYREKLWSSSTKIEFRDAQSEDRYGVVASIFGEPRPYLGMALSATLYDVRAIGGLKKDNGDIQLSMVYRPRPSRWIIFDRLNFKFDEQSGGEFNSDNWRIINNLSINHRLNRKTRISFQHGAKYLREYMDGSRFSDYIDLIGLELRYDITCRWDIGVRSSLLHSWNLKQYDYSNGLSVGYNLFKNAWLSIGYNFSGFEDRDFSSGGYSAQGPYLQFRLKIDYESVKSVIGIFRSTNGNFQY